MVNIGEVIMQRSNKDTLRIFFDAAKANNSEQMLAVLHPNLQVIEADSLPYGGTIKGRELFAEFTKTVFTTWRNTSVTVEELIGDGQYVVVLATMSGEGKATGEPFNMPIAEVWRFDASGLVVEIKPFYFDTKKLVDVFNGDNL
jgi:ketosteroid isomerase-like protein